MTPAPPPTARRATPSAAPNLHASAVAFGPERAVLITGPSGAGKSTLALALIERGAELVADDQVLLVPDGGALYLRPPRATAGLIESRSLGILRLAHRRLARACLVIELGQPAPPRLPDPDWTEIAGIRLRRLIAPAATGAFARAVANYIGARGLCRHPDEARK